MKWLLAHRFRRTTLVAVFCAAFLVGIGVARVVPFEASWILLTSLLGLFVLRRQRVALLLAVLLCGLCVGGWRGSTYMDKLAVYEPYVDQKVTLIGQAVNDGSYSDRTGRPLAFNLKNTRLVGLDSGDVSGLPGPDEQVRFVGKIGVSGFGENMVFRGDTVQVTGKLRKGSGSHQGWMSFAQLQLVKRNNSLIDKVRLEFGAGMQSALPEPAASFGLGLLIGQNTTLPDTVYDDLLAVGLVHIIAVSGYNLTIILRACNRLLGDKSKYQTMLVSVTLICIFLLLTAGSASIVRASIVSGLSIFAWYYGRNFKPITLILLAALITSSANPLYIWSDLGWYLSFLAFYGVMVLGPQMRFRILPERFRENVILLILLESICAEIMTLPLILYIFGETSAIGLLANVLVAGFVPLAMLLAVIAGVAGMFIAPVAGWIAWPATTVLTYMLDTAHILASVPGAFVDNWELSLAGMVFLYAATVAFNLLLYSRLKRDRAIITALNEENTLLRPSLKYMSSKR